MEPTLGRRARLRSLTYSNNVVFRRGSRRSQRRYSATSSGASRRNLSRVHSSFETDAHLFPAEGAIQSTELPVWKRVLDLAFCTLLIPIALVIALPVSLWIFLVSPGSVMFKQTRIGKGGKPFTMFKFRSMKMDACPSTHERHVGGLMRSGQAMTKLDILGDPRLVMGGCFIRMTGLDELPQLINVLRGEMSLVGPRPCVPKEFEDYTDSEYGRFTVEPGLTGVWQVARKRETTFPQMLEMDESYVAGRSALLDLQLLAKTPFALLCQMGVCFKSKITDLKRQPVRTGSTAESFRGLNQVVRASQRMD